MSRSARSTAIGPTPAPGSARNWGRPAAEESFRGDGTTWRLTSHCHSAARQGREGCHAMAVQSPSVRSIFERALEFASEEPRQAYLDDACAGQAELRARVQAL